MTVQSYSPTFHSSTDSFDKYLLSAHHVPNTVDAKSPKPASVSLEHIVQLER